MIRVVISLRKKHRISEIKKKKVGAVFRPGDYIEGVIISERKNEKALTYVIQDKTEGITICFQNQKEDPTFSLNDSARIKIGKLKLMESGRNTEIYEITKKI